MKKLLFTALAAALTFTGYAQTKSDLDQFEKSEEATLSINNPQKVTITAKDNEVTILAEYEANGILNKYEFSPELLTVQQTTVVGINTTTDTNNPIVFTDADNLTLSKSKNSFRATVTNNYANGYTFEIQQQGTMSQTVSVHKETDTGWDFNIPFINKKQDEQKNVAKPFRPHNELTCNPTFGIGLVSATAQGDDVDLSFSNGSFEFILDELIGVDYHMTRKQHFNVAFGLNWRNYRMTGDKRFIKDGNQIIIGDYPEGANVKFSRIKIFSLTLAFMYKYQFSHHFGVGLGPIVSFNTGGNIKTRWSVDGHPDKDRQYNIRQNPVTVDFKAVIDTDPLSFYFKYSPCNVMTTKRGPEFRSMSAGVLFNF